MAFDWHVVYTHFSNRAIFTKPDEDPVVLQNIVEFGIALSPQDGNWDILFWQPEHLGLSYEPDPDGPFSAITFNVTSWFRR